MVTLAATLPVYRTHTSLLSFLQVLGAACLLALLAQIQIPIPFSPVPLTAQTFGTLLVAATLGSRKGMLSLLTYFGMGCAGLPVFAGGCPAVLALAGPTGGYLIGLAAQIFVAGWLLEHRTHLNSIATFATLVFACALQLALGTLWLGFFVGAQQMFWMGFLPFIPGELLKSALVTGYLKSRQ